jgi:hypothetical protein
VSLLARWLEGGGERSEVGPKGRSKDERISVKMGVPQSEEVEGKKRACGLVWAINWSIGEQSEIYTLVSRARGTY